jgi:hypothetical protein|tara:strand:- start:2734 stop:2973 length:240 start_codon:yes stop_codon:yes gene_type:complete
LLLLLLLLLPEDEEGVIEIFALRRLHLRRRLFLANFDATRTVGLVVPRKEEEDDMTPKSADYRATGISLFFFSRALYVL